MARRVKNLRAEPSSSAFSIGTESTGEMIENADKRRTSEVSAFENISDSECRLG